MSEILPTEKRFPRDSEKTRARILESAIDLFSNRSYDDVRSRDIAKLASVDVALINRYYGSKKELFVAVLDSLAANKPDLTSSDLEQRLCEDFLQRMSGEGHHHTSTCIRIIALSASNPEVAPILRDRMTAEIHRLAEKLGEEGEITATALIAYIMGIHTLLQMLPQEARETLPADKLLSPMRAILHRNTGSGLS